MYPFSDYLGSSKAKICLSLRGNMFSASWDLRSFWEERAWKSWVYLYLWTTPGIGCDKLESKECRGLLYSKAVEVEQLLVFREPANENKHHTHCFADVIWKDPLKHCEWKATSNSHFSIPLHCQCGVMDFSMGKDVVGLNKVKTRRKFVCVSLIYFLFQSLAISIKALPAFSPLYV